MIGVLGLKSTATELKSTNAQLEGQLAQVTEKLEQTKFKLDKAEASSTRKEMEHIKSLYVAESLQRKNLHNKLRCIQGNIRVFCRVRPSEKSVVEFPDASNTDFPAELKLPFPGFADQFRFFEFDRVYSPSATQEGIFEETKPLITSCADGFNVAIITYGQTGAGKTYTLMGSEENPGLNPRSMQELLRVCEERVRPLCLPIFPIFRRSI